VIYCIFWELDSDHDFLLDKEDLLKYDGHALSRSAIDRIFSQIPAKFTAAVPGKMGYDDFIGFVFCDQDRQSDRSLEYWFRLLDLDGDGTIRAHELRYFYEEQVQRLECLNYETIAFADVLCQVNDMISPTVEGCFTMLDFKRRRKFAGTFFSIFLSLNKFLAFEHRDPFQQKQEQVQTPGMSDWDRWCQREYLRLAMEEGEEAEEEPNNYGFIDELDEIRRGPK
jgi:serine/threonine-protein phosphatase 2A regulatory subunit B''